MGTAQDGELEAKDVRAGLGHGVHHERVVTPSSSTGPRLARLGQLRRETVLVTGFDGFAGGRLLVAEPMLGDPNFDRAVVLVLDHTAEGAIGIVLNRPTDLPVADALPAWRQLATDPAVIHVGGPVEEQSGWCLARAVDPDGLVGFVPVLDDLGLIDLSVEPGSIAAVVSHLRLYAGYSGWGPGQLDRELAAEVWFVVGAEVEDPFLEDSGSLWRRILARQNGSLSRLATFPRDPGMN